ncbi:hypothetical protein WICPIJ_006146 [Wickerhamomyces pijperi]|uniref:DNA polymerase epsilon catalytic subunit n=1 Tax=Wickerhamomyces pijperi TaxID=599730 RepID=A0A9P8Q496_WICPI|nr:hypothetical protein WICPIJ_006146 [Wickerhamomyces pijperi]
MPPKQGRSFNSGTARFNKPPPLKSGSNSAAAPGSGYRPNQSGYSNEISSNSNTTITKLQETATRDALDSEMGFDRYDSHSTITSKTGWLINMHETLLPSTKYSNGISAVDYYFLDDEGGTFKSTIEYEPYFYVCGANGYETALEEWIRKSLESYVINVERLTKEDLGIPNHLIGIKRTLLKLTFPNVTDLFEAKKLLMVIVKENEEKRVNSGGAGIRPGDLKMSINLNYDLMMDSVGDAKDKGVIHGDIQDYIEDLREHDVPYTTRVSIDCDLRVGKWYNITTPSAASAGSGSNASKLPLKFTELTERIDFGDPVILAFDIETTKRPLKFPDSKTDQIMMISYMIDGDGFLITNREIISEDIEDFEYTPKAEYPGLFTIFNEDDEKALIERFFEHIHDAKPTIVATFNGDFFDWPFLEARAAAHDIDMFDSIGFKADSEGVYKASYACHMDCFRWVQRDSYLPQGSQGLKAVTTSKLGYNPIELDPELMTPYAYSKPQLLAEYSVSDAVATFYLFRKIIVNFIISLGIIVPLNPDELLRKGTGTLCEMLLMVKAYEGGIVLPNKHMDPPERFYEGHLIESETYVGGHVESLEAGVFRSDLEYDFKIDGGVIDELMSDLEAALRFSIEVEGKKKMEDVTNFQEIYDQIKDKLQHLKDNPVRKEKPLIYHVDVASMYPNIMCSNRLQPDSMKTESDCAACDFNRPGKKCDRRLTWAWRGEYYPAKMNEYYMLKSALEETTFPPKYPNGPRRTYNQLPKAEQISLLKQRVAEYSRKTHHRVKVSKTIKRESIVCQRENPFYVDTVRMFRDKRYDFKGNAKVWKKTADGQTGFEREESKKKAVYYDSLQLAFKVILNSFYGYVMRKGSRWYSIEMAGITCLTGATIIQMARSVIERLGRPLELDTDGIWCIIPSSFPENYQFKLKNGKTVFLSYPCSMLNYLVHRDFTNHQYQTLVDPVTKKYATHSDNSIFFEVDGPYKAMILPTSKEEDKGLKKRYAVFNDDGTLAELKGFELKRRGELQLIKNFQSDIFKLFLEGDSLDACYGAVANVANRWLDVLDTKGSHLEDDDLFELICENKSMSKSLEEYAGQKSTSITTAKRLGEFLGAEMVKDKGLAVKYIISARPLKASVTERAIPVAIFSADLEVKRNFLRRWLHDSQLEDFDPRSIIDWSYYKERLESVIQKIITIPAALQEVSNPVPRVAHPDWLQKRINTKNDKKQQSLLNRFFKKSEDSIPMLKDIEDYGRDPMKFPKIAKVTSKKRKGRTVEEELEPTEQEIQLSRSQCPDPTEDYVGWLTHQKAKWKVQAKLRSRRRQMFGHNQPGSSGAANGGGVSGQLMQNRAKQLTSSNNWQVLEYKPDPLKVGEVKALVVINGKVQSFQLITPRIIYVLFQEGFQPQWEKLGSDVSYERVNKKLPNVSVASTNLYELTMSESTFLDESSRDESLLNHEKVLGVYESQIPLHEKVILALGNTISFQPSSSSGGNQPGALGRALKSGFQFRDLSKADIAGSSVAYLSQFSMDLVYLHQTSSNGYTVYTLFQTWDSKVQMFVLKPTRSALPLTNSTHGIFNKTFQELLKTKGKIMKQFGNTVQYQESLDLEIAHFEESDKLLRRLNSYLNKITEERSSKPLLLMDMKLTSSNLESVMKKLKTVVEFPMIQKKASSYIKSNSANEEGLTNSVHWQPTVIKDILNNYISISKWLHTWLQLAQQSNIPLCNVKPSDVTYLIDVEYSRRLTDNDIILWWSAGSKADYGGSQLDDRSLSLVEDDDDFKFPVLNKPEIYQTTSVEINIRNLTMNTILTSALFNEAEGSTGADIDLIVGDNSGSNTNAVLAEDSFNGASLTVLRNMLKNWYDQAEGNETEDESESSGAGYYDRLVDNFIPWVFSCDSYMFDSYLKYHMHNLTRKALFQLLSEFKKLGSSVIHADRNKLILKTSKISVGNSYAYSQYIVKAIRLVPLFSYLHLEVVRYWDVLIWFDKYNYAGLQCTEIKENGQEEEDDESDGDHESQIDQDLRILRYFNLQLFLTTSLQGEFEHFIDTFIFALKMDKNRIYGLNIDSSNPQSTQRATQINHLLINSGANGTANELTDDQMRSTDLTDLFRVELLQRLDKVNKIARFRHENNEKPLGYHLPATNPMLSFIKSICFIMSLSKQRALEMRLLRKELLQIVQVEEFSNDSNFVNPSTSLVVPMVICSHCQHITDLDFVKDTFLDLFKCEKCGNNYSKSRLEELLISQLIKLIDDYHRQDFKCVKCHKLKTDQMSLNCSCSGQWVQCIDKKIIRDKIRIFKDVSMVHDLVMLKRCIASF